MNQAITQSVILFLLMAAGFAAGKAKILTTDATQGLSKFLVDFTLPALIIVSMQKPFSEAMRNEALTVLAISSCVYAVTLPLAYGVTALLGASERERGVHRFAACFSNVGFMGFPVMQALFGTDSLFTVSVYNIPFQLLAFSVGIAMISGYKRSTQLSLRSFVNPAIVAALLGFALFLFSVAIPEPFVSALRLLGDTTTPLSMAVIGAILSRADPRRIFGNSRVYGTTVYRLIIHPLAIYAALYALSFRGFALIVPTMIAAMPVAANTTLLAGVYGGDAETGSSLVFVSTAAALITIPILASVLFGM